MFYYPTVFLSNNFTILSENFSYQLRSLGNAKKKNKIGEERESLIFSIRNVILNINGVLVEFVLLARK